jgi:hypothetical protein
MSGVDAWLDPRHCPADRPPLSSMGARTRSLHDALDAHARRTGLPYLHPNDPTVRISSARHAPSRLAGGKAAFMFASEDAG